MKKLIRGRKKMEHELEKINEENESLRHENERLHKRLKSEALENCNHVLKIRHHEDVITGLKVIIFAMAFIIAALAVSLFVCGHNAHAETLTRYTTQTVTLQDSRNGKALTKVKRNTKVKQIKAGKVWARVKYKGDLYKVRKRFLCESRSPKKYTAAYFRRAGVIRWGGVKWTYYSQRLLPGTRLKIPGRHLDKNGFVVDKDGYIVIAVTPAMRKARTIVPTPFGRYGKVYDCGAGGTAWRDCFVNW